MVNEEAVYRAFADYAEALLGTYDIGAVLYRLADQAVDVLGADGAGVLLVHDGRRLGFVAATDGDVAAVQAEQVSADDGPGHHAYRTGEVVSVTDLGSDDRGWPRPRTVALARGIRALLSVPMPVAERRIGALTVYRHAPHDWTDEERRVTRILADMASGYILNSSRLEEVTTLADQLQEALDSRVVIEQAKGILAERNDISPSAAFEQLRSHARDHQTRVHEVAERVVDGTLDL